MMKRINIMLVILLTGFSLVSGCVNEPLQSPLGESDKITIGIALNASRGAGDNSDALPEESSVTSAYVYIFNAAGHLENRGETQVHLKNESPVSEGVLNRSWKVYPGLKDIYVVLNPGTITDNGGGTIDFSTYSPANKTSLDELRTASGFFNTDFSSGHLSGMLMTGMIQADVTGESQIIPLDVRRRYSKVEVSVKKEADLNGTDVIIKKVTLKDYSTQSMLWGLGDGWAESASDMTGQSQTMSKTVVENSGYTDLEFTRYMMPHPASTTNIPFVEIEASVGGINKKFKAYFTQIGDDGKNDLTKPIAIKANKIYRMKVTILRGEVDVDLSIEGWNDFNIDAPVAGASITASELVLSDTEEFGNVEFTVNPVPDDKLIGIDWSNMPESVKRDESSVIVDDNGRGTIKVEWVGDSSEREPFEGKIIISSGAISKAVGVMSGIYIPDPEFRKYLRAKGFISYSNDYGLCRVLEAGKIAEVIDLSSYKTVSDLTGIENFTAIKELKIGGTNVAFMDLSENTLLETVDCSATKLKSLNVKMLKHLKTLNCSNNDFSADQTIDVSGNEQLSTFYCNATKITRLDLSENTLLKDLNCNSNDFSINGLDLRLNRALTTLKCASNGLYVLDLQNNTNLGTLECQSNNLTNLDLSYCSNSLVYLVAHTNSLTTLNITDCTKLGTLNIAMNPLFFSGLTGFSTSIPLKTVNLNYMKNLDKGEFIANMANTVTAFNVSSNGIFNDGIASAAFDDDDLSALLAKVGDKLTTLYCVDCTELGKTQSTHTMKLPASLLEISGNQIERLIFTGNTVSTLWIGGDKLMQVTINDVDCVNGDSDNLTLTLPEDLNVSTLHFRNTSLGTNPVRNYVIENNPYLTTINFINMRMSEIQINNNTKLSALKISNCYAQPLYGYVTENQELDTRSPSTIITAGTVANEVIWSDNKDF